MPALVFVTENNRRELTNLLVHVLRSHSQDSVTDDVSDGRGERRGHVVRVHLEPVRAVDHHHHHEVCNQRRRVKKRRKSFRKKLLKAIECDLNVFKSVAFLLCHYTYTDEASEQY